MRTNNNNKGILRIDTGGNNLCKVIFQPAGGTVWLRKAELSSLFGVCIQTTNACLDAILKENIIDVKVTCKYELYANGNRIRYDIREVNLEVIIAMAFRIDSYNAKILKKWFIRRCIHPGISGSLPLDTGQSFCLN